MSLEILAPDLGEIPVFPVTKPDRYDWRDGVLIRTPNWLGDIVMTLPAMMQLRRAVPEKCGIFVACPKGLAPVFHALPDLVDKVVELRDAHRFPTRAEMSEIRALYAGIGILFNNSFRDALWMKAALIPRLYGAAARNRSWLLTRAFQFPKRQDRVLNRPHHAAKYLSMSMALGAPAWDGSLPEFRIPYEPECASDAVRKAVESEHVLAVAPGAAYGAAKRWDTERFQEVCRWWLEEKKGYVVVLSARNEAELASAAVEGLSGDHVIDLAGKTTLTELMKSLQNAEMCVANDSGNMHLSAVLGGKGVAPFGPTDPAATSPVSAKWSILFNKQECAPCFKRVCPNGSKKCLTCITAQDVITRIQSLLNG